jgi:succinyl-CoA synthetase alpha subunit
MDVTTKVIKNSYFDSVTLMLLSSKVSSLEGIENAAVMMGTEMNKGIMESTGLLKEGFNEGGPNDLIISIKAINDEAITKAMVVIDEFINNKKSDVTDEEIFPKTLDSAFEVNPSINLALISVPGQYGKNEAMKALNKGLHVHLFSDNVTIEEELELKKFAAEKGLLMMGPDCGSAIINGVGIGFANKVKRGSIGVVAAAGTGLQEVTTLVSQKGAGISQALGTGGRDLKEKIGGLTMLMALEALAQDDETKAIIMVSKPPAETVMKKIMETVKKINKPVVVCLLGGDPQIIEEHGAIPALTLEDAAELAVANLKGFEGERVFFTLNENEISKIVQREIYGFNNNQKYLRGIYTGGTLCYEGMLILKEFLGGIYSNVPLNEKYKLSNSNISVSNTFIDMGEDEFTVGRPHPMIDPSLRNKRILQEANDPEVAVILMDVVIGYGAHEDPAEGLVKVIKEAREIAKTQGRNLSFVASVCGTEEDFQIRSKQEQKLVDAGVIVMPSNSQAARMAGLINQRGEFLDVIGRGE